MEHREMFKTWFRNADNDQHLAGPIYLPTLPERGDTVRIRERPGNAREDAGQVAKRTWLIVSREPDESEAIIYVAFT